MIETNVRIRSQILLSLQVALLGEVFPSLRGVAVQWDGGTINILAYVDGLISDDDQESLSCVETEIMSDFPDHDVTLETIHCDTPARLPVDTVWVYRRKES